jgi:hypothetical protein
MPMDHRRGSFDAMLQAAEDAIATARSIEKQRTFSHLAKLSRLREKHIKPQL